MQTKNVLLAFLGCLALLSCNNLSNTSTLFQLLDSQQTGITFENTITETDSFNILREEYMYNGGGVGVADLNNDGLMDLLFAGNRVKSRIYLNEGNFVFKDITEQFIGLDKQAWISGIAITDINEDGWQDVYFTCTFEKNPTLRKNQLWVNQGLNDDGLPTFKEQAEVYGIADTGYGMHAVFFDYNKDGLQDLYILNNIVNKEIPTNYRPKITDGTSINNDQLYKNLGNGKFQNVTIEAGITYEGFGLGLAVGDVNKDGYPDIYISNDYISNDLLYLNQQDGTFREVAAEYFPYQSKFSMGNDLADANNDGNLDLITVDMLPQTYDRVKRSINGNSYYIYVNDNKHDYQHQYVRNMLYLHNGFVDNKMIGYSEVGQMMGIQATEWSWSPLLFDADNDGDRDLLITNGFPKDLTDKDFTNYRSQMQGFLMTDRELAAEVPIVHIANYGFENVDNQDFVNQAKAWGLDRPSFSNGAAYVDLDQDGDLDYVVNNINQKAFVYKNQSRELQPESSNFITLKLEGEKNNPNAIGAKVNVWSGGQQQYSEQYLSRGYISSITPILHFGLKEKQIVDSIEIVWADGNIQKAYAIAINQKHVFKKQENVALQNTRKENVNKVFTQLPTTIPYQHREEDEIDFFYAQRIIPHKFTQFGPKVVLENVIGNDEKELIVAGNEMHPITIYQKETNDWKIINTIETSTKQQLAQADIKVADLDNDGDKDIITVTGPSNLKGTKNWSHYWYENVNGKFITHPLPLPKMWAKTLEIADVNQDGFMDIFVGATAVLDSFPYAYPSYILYNKNGNFENATPIDAGIVQDVVVNDINQDGWQDLLIAAEWRKPQFFINQQGNGFDNMDLGIDNMQGLWSAIEVKDLDGDGKSEVILGNLGQNHRFNIDAEHPMRLYSLDVDKNGVDDPIITAYWSNEDGQIVEFPVNYWDELMAQSPYFRKKFKSYTQFSRATIDSLLSQEQIANSKIYTVNNTASGILWNTGNGFEWEALPNQAQVAPISCILANDFTNNQHQDLLLLGNNHTYDVSTGFYDANKGILLKNNGKRKLDFSTNQESGLAINGQVECIAASDNLLVIGINRDSLQFYSF